jgi:glycosyltransferase involved in cell wall biosynthesis
MSQQRPLVSAIITTYQFEDYLAESIESVLAQDYPADRLEVIVMDDGSTDSTPAVVAPYLDRVRYVRKENGGLLSSVNRGFAEASGELLALQSGDDMWTPEKLARQVEIFERRPEVGLVYGDMTVVDNDQQVLNPSFWAMSNITPQRGRPLGALMRGNFVSGGTLMVRSALRERFHPLPAHAGWEDWWIATRVAEVAELEYVSEAMLRYRFHGANMSLGADESRSLANAAHEMPFRRWLLTDLLFEHLTPADLAVGCRLYEHCVVTAAKLRELSTESVVPREPRDAECLADALRRGSEALAHGDTHGGMHWAARAFGHDLHDPRARALFQEACTALEHQPEPVAAVPASTTMAPATATTGERPHAASSGGPAPTAAGTSVSTPDSDREPHPPKAPGAAPRVTLGIATFNRATYLAAAITSALEQDYDDFEVLVVDDGSSNPEIAEVLDGFDDPRLRVVRHPENLGIAASYNTMISEGRGELLAMIGDDDICLPGRLAREVAIFDAHPDTGVVHGDAVIIDSAGNATGRWDSRDFTPAALVHAFFRSHNHLVDPTRMVHRRVYEDVGGYDGSYRIAQDMHFWLRAAREHRFRHCPGGPVTGFRRHGANTSDESARELEIDDVERALTMALELYPLRELVPELDWAVLDPADAERQALLALADALERRLLPLPRLAAQLRARATAMPVAPARHSGAPKGRLMMTAFGWNDSGGGTIVPRLAAKELARRGWEVTVFHAATGPTESGLPYEVVESEQDGVKLIAVHNRAHGIWDLRNPLRELDDPPITAAFAAALDRVRPDAVHFHNLHNLGAALMDQAAARGLPAFFSTHNYWLICPRAYLITGGGEICAGPGDGSACASCVHSAETEAHRLRLDGIRARFERGVGACLTVSEAVRRTLLGAGYPAETLDVVRQGMPHDSEIWDRLGRERKPGRVGEQLTVAFLGSAYPHKGPQLLVEAAQHTEAQLRVQIHGEIPDAFAAQLLQLDQRGVVELCGPFQPSEIDRVLAGVDVAALPSIWWDCAPLAAAECLAARVPLLVPRLGGLAEAITDGVDGLAFDALDAQDLTRCLDRVAGEPGLLERLQSQIQPPRPFSDYVDDLEAYYAGERPGRVRTALDAPQLAVRWQGDHGLKTSLSIINTRVTELLDEQVQRVGRGGKPLDRPLPHAADVEVRHQWPPDFSPVASGRLAVIQPWEYGAIPRAWIEPLRDSVDELWVPSEYVRKMYLAAGLEPERVVSVPNGVDLELFHPEGERYEPRAGITPSAPADASVPSPSTTDDATPFTRFLFVGGLIVRKGPDILLNAWREAFAGRDDVELVVKDVGVGGVYRKGERAEIVEYAASGALPRLTLIDDELDERELAALYRSCDVLVHPYRGEGFAMGVLEAMACGTPVIVTAGGPTDEFCPPDAGWRIASVRAEFPEERVGAYETLGRPWMLEPDGEDLTRLLREVAADPGEVARRGAAARVAAEQYGWDAIARRYSERLVALANRAPVRPAVTAREFEEQAELRLLATPAWRGVDRLRELLEQWASATSAGDGNCLYLLADPRCDGSEEQIEAHVLATGVDLEHAGDITVLIEPIEQDGYRSLHKGLDAFLPLHDACQGHARLATAAGNAVLSLDDGSLTRLLAGQRLQYV